MVLPLRMLATLQEDENLAPSTHIRWLIPTCNSSLKELDSPLASVHTHAIKNIIKSKKIENVKIVQVLIYKDFQDR